MAIFTISRLEGSAGVAPRDTETGIQRWMSDWGHKRLSRAPASPSPADIATTIRSSHSGRLSRDHFRKPKPI
jgi:hypothetical protein